MCIWCGDNTNKRSVERVYAGITGAVVNGKLVEDNF